MTMSMARTLTVHVVKNGASVPTLNTIVKGINIDGGDLCN